MLGADIKTRTLRYAIIMTAITETEADSKAIQFDKVSFTPEFAVQRGAATSGVNLRNNRNLLVFDSAISKAHILV